MPKQQPRASKFCSLFGVFGPTRKFTFGSLVSGIIHVYVYTTYSHPRIHDRGNHSGLCASSRIGALPSRIPRPVNVTACLMTDILSPSPSHPPPPKSPGSRSIVVETAATSGSSGTTRGGNGGPSSNAVTGCKVPKRRIQRSVALSETRTCQDPPSCCSSATDGPLTQRRVFSVYER
jgi:hypothetical protein